MSEWFIAAAASAQAFAAGALVFYTRRLTAVTDRYARHTGRLTDLQDQANRIFRANLRHMTGRNAPSLQAFADTTHRIEGTNEVEAQFHIANDGATAAMEIELDSSWGTVRVPSGVGPGAGTRHAERRPFASWDSQPPLVRGYRFRDPSGRHWKQRVGGVPEMVDPDLDEPSDE